VTQPSHSEIGAVTEGIGGTLWLDPLNEETWPAALIVADGIPVIVVDVAGGELVGGFAFDATAPAELTPAITSPTKAKDTIKRNER
jgi:hypothetical protein